MAIQVSRYGYPQERDVRVCNSPKVGVVQLDKYGAMGLKDTI